MFKTTPQEEQKKKDEQDKEKQKLVDNLKKTQEENRQKKNSSSISQNTTNSTHQFNEIEAEMYKKEGINVEDYGANIMTSEGKVKLKKDVITDVTDLVNKSLSLGSINTEAKGLNNTLNSLIIYNPNSTNLSITVNPQAGQQAFLKTNYGNYGGYDSQRWCFNNNTNEITLMANSGSCSNTQSYSGLCLDNLGGNTNYGDRVGVWYCNGLFPQKWFFDEMGRIAMVVRPDLCVDGESNRWDWGARMILWGCRNDSQNQTFRAGYNNHGTGMGMTMWASDFGNWHYNLWGHAFVELWNGIGTHNTFSRWNTNDNNCSWINSRVNNMCDNDAITSDVEFDSSYDPKYNVFRKYGIYINKIDWDYIVFGSGHRNNYWQGNQINLGGSGTYCYACTITSRSRDPNFQASYGYSYLYDVCSGYSIKLWNAYRAGNRSFNFSSHWVVGNPSPATIYYQI
jgi:hypothetical protein